MKLPPRTARTARLAIYLLLVALVLVASAPASPAGPWPSSARAEALTQPEDPSAFVAGEVLLRPAPGSEATLTAFLQSVGASVVERLKHLGVLRLQVPPGTEREAVARLEASPLVEWAEPNYLRAKTSVPNDQLYRQYQWNLRKIEVERAWDLSTGNPDVVVAVLDTGVDAAHPDLAGKLVAGYDVLNDDASPSDDSGHGTHNAGVIAAASNNGIGIAGLSWGTRVMPIKVLNSSGVGPDSVIARGLTRAADQGARVINMSFGSSTSSRLLGVAMGYAASKGVLLVAAAGNTARTGNPVIYPAAYSQVLAVSATDESDKVPDFSQHHPYVGVSAPGVRIVSTFWRGSGYGNYVSASGTSAAAPHVSGLAALIWSVGPSLSANRVREIIQSTADDLGSPGRDDFYGAGRINALKALLAAKPGAAPPPVAQPTPAPAPAPAPTPASLPRTVWYFAEGSTSRPFDLWLLLQNPNAAVATVKVTYMLGDGSRRTQEVALPASSRRSIYVNLVVPDKEVSMKVESDSLIFAERAMYFGNDGHVSTGAAAPATRWYMAEGSTKGDFDTWILLQNPLATSANVNVAFLTPDGQRKEVVVGVPPTARRSIYVNQVLPGADFSTVVASDEPVIAERAMYFKSGGGHGSLAASQLSRTWYLAEGVAGNGFDTWLLALNPGQQVANLKVTYMLEDGSSPVAYYAIAPGSRLSVYVNQAVPAGRVGARVESDQPIVAERATYFSGGRGGHNAVGASLLSQEWYLPEGSTKPPFSESLAVINPNDRVANLAVTFMRVDGTSEVKHFAMNPSTRLTLDVNALMPDSEVSAKVVSDMPVAVERSMYFAGGLGGTSSFGIPR